MGRLKNISVVYSIIVATKNNSRGIGRFLTSLKNCGILNRNDTEIIIVDNNSYSQEVLKIKKLCKEYKIVYIFEPRPGQSCAVNTGIANAKGKFIVFTDDDVEVYDVNWLDRLSSHFKRNKNLGYVSGNVKAKKLVTEAQKAWEAKGGLSKGPQPKYFSIGYLVKFKFKPWPLTKICAGANSMVPKKIINKIGGYSLLFNHGAGIIGHGASLEFGYKIIKAGYELYYDPEAIVFHNHPRSNRDLKKKLFYYGIGDTAIHIYFFLKYLDFRSLFWAYGGHQFYIIGNMIKRILGKHPLPLNYLFYSLTGSSIGAILFLIKYLIKKIMGTLPRNF